MPRKKGPRSIALYRDVQDALDTILRHDQYPAQLKFDTNNQATRWAFRAHTFRSVLREQEEWRLSLPKGTGSSLYDNFLIQIREETVIISMRTIEAKLIIAGEEVPISHEPSLEEFNEEEGLDLIEEREE